MHHSLTRFNSSSLRRSVLDVLKFDDYLRPGIKFWSEYILSSCTNYASSASHFKPLRLSSQVEMVYQARIFKDNQVNLVYHWPQWSRVSLGLGIARTSDVTIIFLLWLSLFSLVCFVAGVPSRCNVTLTSRKPVSLAASMQRRYTCSCCGDGVAFWPVMHALLVVMADPELLVHCAHGCVVVFFHLVYPHGCVVGMLVPISSSNLYS